MPTIKPLRRLALSTRTPLLPPPSPHATHSRSSRPSHNTRRPVNTRRKTAPPQVDTRRRASPEHTPVTTRRPAASCEQLPVLEARGLPLPVHEARGHRAWPLGYNLPVLLPSFKVVLHLPRPCAFAPLHLIICTSAACPCNNSSLLPTLLCRQHSQHLSNPVGKTISFPSIDD